jgi:FkbM family methyltransferase
MSEIVNKTDVYYCYRLLLGRDPDPPGMEQWMRLVQTGEITVSQLVSGFLNSSEFVGSKLDSSYTFSSKTCTLVDLQDFKMYVPIDDYIIGRHIAQHKAYEPHVTSILRKHLSPGMVFVDVGANLGYFSLLAASLVKQTGKIYAFEPGQNNYNYLLLNTKLNSFENIDVYPFAAAEKKSCFEYLASGSNGAISETDYTIEALKDKILVRSVVIDEVLSDVEQIHVIKTDTEGAEFRVLSGAARVIKRCRPIIFSEFSPPMLQSQSKVTGESFLRTLVAENYHISVIAGVDKVIDCKDDIARVIKCFDNKNSTHIDLVAYPQ